MCGLDRADIVISRRGVNDIIIGTVKNGVGRRREMVSVRQARYVTVKARGVVAAIERLIWAGIKGKADVSRGSLLLLEIFNESCKSFFRGELRV